MSGKTLEPSLRQAGSTKASALHNEHQLANMTVKEAVAAGAFRLNFQPTVCLDESDKQFFEVRCGLAYNSEFLCARQLFNIANKQQLGAELDRWIITHVIELMQLYSEPNLILTVWIGRASIRDGRFIDWIAEQLANTARMTERIIFQISQRDALRDKTAVQQFCRSLKDMGFSICLNEGAEELNSEALSRHLSLKLAQDLSADLPLEPPVDPPLDLPLDYLKLAPEFIHHIAHESKRRLRLKKRVAALNRRGIRVIAAQLDDMLLLPILWKARVDFVQGNCLQAPDQNINTGFPHHQAISLN